MSKKKTLFLVRKLARARARERERELLLLIYIQIARSTTVEHALVYIYVYIVYIRRGASRRVYLFRLKKLHKHRGIPTTWNFQKRCPVVEFLGVQRAERERERGRAGGGSDSAAPRRSLRRAPVRFVASLSLTPILLSIYTMSSLCPTS